MHVCHHPMATPHPALPCRRKLLHGPTHSLLADAAADAADAADAAAAADAAYAENQKHTADIVRDILGNEIIEKVNTKLQ